MPNIRLPFVQPAIARLGVDEQNARGAFDQPSAIEQTNATLSHPENGLGELRVRRGHLFNLDSCLWKGEEDSIGIHDAADIRKLH